MRRPAVVAGLLLLAGCSHSQPDIATLTSNSDQVIWEAGQKALQKRNYESARQHFRRIIDGFPQSPYSPGARLALGDSYAKEGGNANDILAIAAYRDFLTLYPSHPQSDYAQFQVAEAYFRQRNGPDRDQTQTTHALEEYERLLDLYPASSHVEQGRRRIRECRQSLARAEYLAGSFYQRTRQFCRAAIARYQGIIKEYPDFDELDQVRLHLAECLHAEGRTPEALPQLSRVVEDYPQSDVAATARELIAQWSQEPPPSPEPAASPSPVPPAGPSPSPATPSPSPAVTPSPQA